RSFLWRSNGRGNYGSRQLFRRKSMQRCLLTKHSCRSSPATSCGIVQGDALTKFVCANSFHFSLEFLLQSLERIAPEKIWQLAHGVLDHAFLSLQDFTGQAQVIVSRS